MTSRLKCHDTYIETLTIICKNGLYMPLGFRCVNNYLVARVYDNSRFQGNIDTGSNLEIYLVKDGLVFYKALKRALEIEYRKEAKCYIVKELENTVPKIQGIVTSIERGNGYVHIKVQPYNKRALEILSINGYTRADGCLIEILVYYTKCKAGVINANEYNAIYDICARSISRSSESEAYTEALDDLKC
jgi:hypothetical protein